MQEYIIIYRRNLVNRASQPSLTQLQQSIGKWQNWIAGLSTENKLSCIPRAWERTGYLITKEVSGKLGTYAEHGEPLNGFIAVYAEDYDEVYALVFSCPVFELGGCLEVRSVF